MNIEEIQTLLRLLHLDYEIISQDNGSNYVTLSIPHQVSQVEI